MAVPPRYENPKDIGEWFYNHEAEQRANSRGPFYKALEELLEEAYKHMGEDIAKNTSDSSPIPPKTSKSSKTEEK